MRIQDLTAALLIAMLSGISMVNAALNTQFLIDRFPIDGIVFSGIAGGARYSGIIFSNRSIPDTISIPSDRAFEPETYRSSPHLLIGRPIETVVQTEMLRKRRWRSSTQAPTLRNE